MSSQSSGDYERDPVTKQGKPDALRCRLCGATKARRRLPLEGGKHFHLLYCPTCDHIPLRSKG